MSGYGPNKVKKGKRKKKNIMFRDFSEPWIAVSAPLLSPGSGLRTFLLLLAAWVQLSVVFK